MPRVKKYVDSVALNGVAVNYPQVVNGTWQVFDPSANAYIDTGINAQGNDGEQGEVPQFRISGRMLQYKFDTQIPSDWTDLYEFSAALTYTHNQNTPAAVWNIQHNLGGLPVTILAVDTSGDQIIGQMDIQASTINLLVYRFSEPLAGKAYIKF
jgi:hypothetical protein